MRLLVSIGKWLHGYRETGIWNIDVFTVECENDLRRHINKPIKTDLQAGLGWLLDSMPLKRRSFTFFDFLLHHHLDHEWTSLDVHIKISEFDWRFHELNHGKMSGEHFL